MDKQVLIFTLGEPLALSAAKGRDQGLSRRETKNTIRFQEDNNGKPPAIGTLYVQKWLLGNDPPRKLTIAIGEAEAQL